jgi:hypothetical protein
MRPPLIVFLAFVSLMPLTGTVVRAEGHGAFVGGGLSMENMSLNTPDNSASKFLNQGYFLEGGYRFGWGGLISGEYGQTNAINTLSSQNYMETGESSFVAAKLGYSLKSIDFGVGYRQTDLTLKSLSLQGTRYLESEYSGGTPLGFVNLNFSFKNTLRSVVELQYISGALTSSNTALPEMSVNNISVSLRLLITFD